METPSIPISEMRDALASALVFARTTDALGNPVIVDGKPGVIITFDALEIARLDSEGFLAWSVDTAGSDGMIHIRVPIESGDV